jgi:anti-sigma factor RsiW
VPKSCPSGDRLLLFLEGALDTGESKLVEEHVSGCDACAGRLRELKHLTAMLRGSDAAPVSRGPDCPDGETLASYADGSIPDGRRPEIEEHLANCRSCLSEVADLWALSGGDAADVSDAVVSRVLEQLNRHGRAALLEWKGKTLSVIRDFAHGLAASVSGEEVEAVAAMAVARAAGGESATLCWTDLGGARLECVVALVGGEPRLAGRLSVPEGRVRGVSVSVSGAGVRRGPESPDAHGRFGPWPVAEGRNLIVLSGLSGQDGAVELVLNIEQGDAEAE